MSECADCGCMEHDENDVEDELIEILQTGKCQRPEPVPPNPFRQRLAEFVQCDESEVMRSQAKQSKMSLQISTPIGPYVGPKSTGMIRRILTRIIWAVRANRRTK